MATVPGDPGPSNVTSMLPKWAQPTMADFLQAAAIMDQKGRFAMDTSQMRPSTNIEDVREKPQVLKDIEGVGQRRSPDKSSKDLLRLQPRPQPPVPQVT